MSSRILRRPRASRLRAVAPATNGHAIVPVKLDIGCGKNKQAGFVGVDIRYFPGVDFVADFRSAPWTLHEVAVVDKESVAARYPLHGKTVDGRWWYGVPGRQPIADASVDEIHASHFLEHLDGMERVHFVNEVYRVLKPEGKATIICPHWASCRAYGDVTHKWPPVSEMWFYYLSKEWRDLNAPHNDFYECDFNAVWGWAMHPSLMARAQEFQQNATQFYKEAIQDVHVTLTPKPKPA